MKRRDPRGATRRVRPRSGLLVVVSIVAALSWVDATPGGLEAVQAAAPSAVESAPAPEPAATASPGLLAFSRRLSSGRFQLFSIRPDGTHETLLTGEVGSGHDAEPAWSPNGRRIVYSRYANGHARLYVTDAVGQVETQLTAVPQLWEDTQPAWSPDGSKIAFRRRNHLGQFDLWVMDADGANATRLTTVGRDHTPVWSPDGTRIAFTRGQDSPEASTDIWVMDADGTDQVALTSMVWPMSAGQPTWSPDGSTVLFAADHEYAEESYSREIATSAPGGGGLTWLTDDPSVAHAAPAWSPDGAHIAYDEYTSPTTDSQLVVMDADGSNRVVLADDPRTISTPVPFGQEAETAVWSPDGLRVAFVSNRDTAPASNANQLYVVGIDGTGLTRLTHSATDVLSTDVEPSWQADATPPKVTLTSPADGLRVDRGDRVVANYSCRDRESGIKRCTGTVANGMFVDTGTVGPHTFTVTAKDVAGNTATTTVTYTVERRRPDAWIRVGGDPDIGDSVYNSTAAGQTVTAEVQAQPGARATFTVTVENDGTGAERFNVRGQGATAAFRVVYLEGGVDVTGRVTGGSYWTARLDPGARATLTMRVTFTGRGDPGSWVSRTVTAVSSKDGSKADVVRARVDAV